MARRELIVLSIDPGPSTSWALLDRDGGIVGTGSLASIEVDTALDELIRLANRSGRNVEVVLERMLPVAGTGHLAHELEYVRRTILAQLEVFDLRAVDIKPSEVVLEPIGIETWNGKRLTWHQRSAIRLGRYYLARRDQMRRRRPV